MAQVRVMLSYDYNHFEIALSADDYPDLEPNELRKQAQRLCDEAVRQYKVARTKAGQRLNLRAERANLEREIEQIRKIPESEWSAEQKAKIKALEDREYWERHRYDYEDDFEGDWEDSFYHEDC